MSIHHIVCSNEKLFHPSAYTWTELSELDTKRKEKQQSKINRWIITKQNDERKVTRKFHTLSKLKEEKQNEINPIHLTICYLLLRLQFHQLFHKQPISHRLALEALADVLLIYTDDANQRRIWIHLSSWKSMLSQGIRSILYAMWCCYEPSISFPYILVLLLYMFTYANKYVIHRILPLPPSLHISPTSQRFISLGKRTVIETSFSYNNIRVRWVNLWKK